MFILGACMGSFLCCQARRLRIEATKSRKLGSRSVCLHCRRQIRWYDNIPVVSWLILKGKCRYCHHPIGAAEIISELCLAISFLALGATISVSSSGALDWVIFALMLVFILLVGFLAIYDGLYGELPTTYLTISIICAIIILCIKTGALVAASSFSLEYIWPPLTSVLVLGGLYLFLYLVSRGKWVGDGDWLLATAVAVVLGHPWLALITLFLANFMACVFALIFVKNPTKHKIHLGPFLVLGFVITFTFAPFFMSLI